MKPFDLGLAEEGHPLITREGNKAVLMDINAGRSYLGKVQNIHAQIYDSQGNPRPAYFFKDGRFMNAPSQDDLFLDDNYGFLWPIGTKVRVIPGKMMELFMESKLTDPPYNNGRILFWADQLCNYEGLEGEITNNNSDHCWRLEVLAYYVRFKDKIGWWFAQDWLQPAALTATPHQDIPGYTDTYVSGDEFMQIIRACSGDHL